MRRYEIREGTGDSLQTRDARDVIAAREIDLGAQQQRHRRAGRDLCQLMLGGIRSVDPALTQIGGHEVREDLHTLRLCESSRGKLLCGSQNGSRSSVLATI